MVKAAVITGAGAGVGRATALEFARNGYDVAMLSRDSDSLESLAREIEKLGRRALAIPTDVADADQVEEAASRVESEFGAIDTWVNVAMATVFAPVAKLTPAEVARHGGYIPRPSSWHDGRAEAHAAPWPRQDRECRFRAGL